MNIEDRPDPAPVGTELELLSQFLDFHRATVLWKCDGVSEADLRRAMVPSGTTMLGLVKHLAWVERYWFRKIFRGERQIPFPVLRGGSRRGTADRVRRDGPQIFALYREACDESRAAIAGSSPEDAAQAR